jgi:hypothetical protein
MKIGDVERAKDLFTGKASDVVRQLAFAGIAVIWLVRADKSAHPIPVHLVPALTLFSVALACDLFQYTISSVIWSVYYRRKLGENLADGTDFPVPVWLPFPGWCFFILKVGVTLVAWVWLATSLIEMWQLTS